MKEFFAPFVLFGYVFSVTLLSVFAFIAAKEAYDPEFAIQIIVCAIVVNVVCVVTMITWLVNENHKETEQ